MAEDIKIAHVYKVNGRLVVAKDAVEAINILNEYLEGVGSKYNTEEITSLELITDGYPCSSNTAIFKSPKIDISLEDIRKWFTDNILNSNKSIEDKVNDLHTFITSWKRYN